MEKPPASVKVPEPKHARRRASAVSRVFLWTFLLFLIGAIATVAAAIYTYREYTSSGPLAENKVFVVQPGLGTPEIGAALEEGGIIKDARIFSAMAYVTGTRTRLKAGEYDFAKGASMQDVMAQIASGKSITYKLLVPEGWTSEMAAARVNANEVLTGPPAMVPPEGAIMPDTYVFRRGMTRQKLVDDMQAAQADLIQDLWEKRIPDSVIETKEQAVILASIVEKETGVGDERPVIASVFINRLKKGMRLQSDPTIIYGIVGGKGKLDRSLTRTDIETETPYNTYRIDGLPPGPIANPGRAAIEAVLNPQSTDYLYFVADGTGGHAFASSLDEHNRNVAKWRKIAGNAAAAAAAETDVPEAGGATAAAVPAPVEPPAAAELATETPPPAPAAAQALKPSTPDPVVAEPQSTPEVSAAAAEPPPQPAPAPPVAAKAPEPVVNAEAKTAEPVAAVLPPKTSAAAPALKPGSVLNVGGKLVAIPKRNPRR